MKIRITKPSDFEIEVSNANPAPADKSCFQYRISVPIGHPSIVVISERVYFSSGNTIGDTILDHNPDHKSGFECAYTYACNRAINMARGDEVIDEIRLGR